MTFSNLNTERSQPSVESPQTTPVRSSVTVCVKESEAEAWKEVTEIISASRSGAGFTLSRPCAIGRLVLLQTSLPRELRVYDQEAKIYSVIGLVQFCNAAQTDGVTLYNVGVGFIGNKTPNSFKKDPRQNYRITGARSDGLWLIKEVESSFKERKHPRYSIKIPVQITVVNESDRTLSRQDAITVNIGIGGASVVTSLKGKIGEKVKFACAGFDFYSMAVIKGIRKNEKGPGLLHLQFLDGEFPVNRMLTGQMGINGDYTPSASVEQEFFYR